MSASTVDNSLVPIDKTVRNIALSELFRITQITLHCPFHESSLSNCHSMGCRRYFAASRLEVLLHEDDSRSSSRAREHWSFLLVSQLHCGNTDTLKSMSISSSCVNKPAGLSTHRSPRSCLICVYVFVCVFVFIYTFNRHWHTTLHKCPRSWVCAFAAKQDIFSESPQ